MKINNKWTIIVLLKTLAIQNKKFEYFIEMISENGERFINLEF